MDNRTYLRWSETTWTKLQQAVARPGAVLAIPVGSIEQHGPHLPLATDTLVPAGILERLAQQFDGTLILGVPIYHTHAPESDAFPGTVNLAGATLSTVIADLLASYQRHPFDRIVLLNGHMESYQFILEGIRLSATGRPTGTRVLLINWWDLVSEATLKGIFQERWPGWEAEHAALVETSLALALFPQLVDTAVIPTDGKFQQRPYRAYPIDPSYKPASGSFASADGATAQIGEVILAEIVTRLHDLIRADQQSYPHP
jgi:creatinine amidohydrolase